MEYVAKKLETVSGFFFMLRRRREKKIFNIGRFGTDGTRKRSYCSKRPIGNVTSVAPCNRRDAGNYFAPSIAGRREGVFCVQCQ